MRERWILDPKTGKLVPAHEYVRAVSKGPILIRDISGYKSVVTGEYISTRRRHREALAETGCIELGNEIPQQQQKRELPPIEHDIKRSIEELKSR